MLSKLIARYLDGFILFSLLGFAIGIIFAVFHLLGRLPIFWHWLYMACTNLGNLLNILRKISVVIPSIPGAFFLLKRSIVCFISP